MLYTVLPESEKGLVKIVTRFYGQMPRILWIKHEAVLRKVLTTRELIRIVGKIHFKFLENIRRNENPINLTCIGINKTQEK